MGALHAYIACTVLLGLAGRWRALARRAWSSQPSCDLGVRYPFPQENGYGRLCAECRRSRLAETDPEPQNKSEKTEVSLPWKSPVDFG